MLVWELVRGASLDQVGERLDDGDVVAVGVELLDALAYAHSQGVIHRDVKPQNVMLGDDGHVKVMDFGIAHLMDADTLTGDGDLIGTIAYMSPEQAQGKRVQPASDVYSAGMVLYELLAGAHPLRGDTPAETYSNVAARAAAVARRAAARPARGPRHAHRRGLRAAPGRAADARLPQRRARRPPAQRPPAQPRRLRKAQRLLRPLGRAAEVAERAGGAALAAVTSAVVVGSLPAYPQSWALPLVALSAAIWAVVPEAGLAFLLGSLAFPLFNVSLSVGGALPRVRGRALPRRPLAAGHGAVAGVRADAHAGVPDAAGAGGGGAAGPRPRPAHRRLGRRRHGRCSCCWCARRAGRSRWSSRAGRWPRRSARPATRSPPPAACSSTCFAAPDAAAGRRRGPALAAALA